MHIFSLMFFSTCRFYSHCEGNEPTLLLIRTTDGDVSNKHKCWKQNLNEIRIKQITKLVNVWS